MLMSTQLPSPKPQMKERTRTVLMLLLAVLVAVLAVWFMLTFWEGTVVVKAL